MNKTSEGHASAQRILKDVAELKRLAEAATQGETKASGNGVHIKTKCVLTTHMEPREQRQADAMFYAAASPAAILELLAQRDELLAALQAIHQRLSDASDVGIYAYEAYDSFYKEMVRAAIEKVTP